MAKTKSKKSPKTKTVKFGKGVVEVPDDAADLVDVDDVQPSLVPMSDEEVKDAGRKLATLCRELKEMRTEHAGVRAEMKAAREAKSEEIDAVAQCIRQQGR